VQELPDILSHIPPTGPSVRVHKLSHRLRAETVASIVAAYEAGATANQLALEFGLAKSSVLAVLRREGVPIRLLRLSPADRLRVVAMYRQGMSQAEIGRRFGRHKSAIWHLLKRAGAFGD
jgi:transposase-like protein